MPLGEAMRKAMVFIVVALLIACIVGASIWYYKFYRVPSQGRPTVGKEEQVKKEVVWVRANIRIWPWHFGSRGGPCYFWNWSNPTQELGCFYWETKRIDRVKLPDGNETGRVVVHFRVEFWVDGFYKINFTSWCSPPANNSTESQRNLDMTLLFGNGTAILLDKVFFVQVNVTGATPDNPYVYEFTITYTYKLVPEIYPEIKSPPYYMVDEFWYGVERLFG